MFYAFMLYPEASQVDITNGFGIPVSLNVNVNFLNVVDDERLLLDISEPAKVLWRYVKMCVQTKLEILNWARLGLLPSSKIVG